jgi:hypothetical protein
VGYAAISSRFRIRATRAKESAMSEQTTVEERLAAVERELADLKRRIPSRADGKSWVERIAGTFKDDPEFEEVVRLGREFRKSVK